MKRAKHSFCAMRDLLAVLGLRKLTPPHVAAHDSAIPGANPKIAEDLSEIWPKSRAKFHAD